MKSHLSELWTFAPCLLLRTSYHCMRLKQRMCQRHTMCWMALEMTRNSLEPLNCSSWSLCLNISIKGMLLKSLHADPQWGTKGFKYLMADRCLRPEKDRHICLRGCYFHGSISLLKKHLEPAWEVLLVLDGLAGSVIAKLLFSWMVLCENYWLRVNGRYWVNFCLCL